MPPVPADPAMRAAPTDTRAMGQALRARRPSCQTGKDEGTQSHPASPDHVIYPAMPLDAHEVAPSATRFHNFGSMSEKTAKEAAGTIFALPSAVMPAAMSPFTMTPLVISTPWGRLRIAGSRRSRLRRITGRWSATSFVRRILFDELVEFAAIQPDTPALRAIVDLDTLLVGKDEIDAAHRAKHTLRPCGSGCRCRVRHSASLCLVGATQDVCPGSAAFVLIAIPTVALIALPTLMSAFAAFLAIMAIVVDVAATIIATTIATPRLVIVPIMIAIRAIVPTVAAVLVAIDLASTITAVGLGHRGRSRKCDSRSG